MSQLYIRTWFQSFYVNQKEVGTTLAEEEKKIGWSGDRNHKILCLERQRDQKGMGYQEFQVWRIWLFETSMNPSDRCLKELPVIL